jgi:ABC-2 type transport system permease protein
MSSATLDPARVSRTPAASRGDALRTVLAMTARDVRVLRHGFVMSAARILIQPLMFVFVFSYVLPSLGEAMPGGSGPGLTTVMLPGLIGSSLFLQGLAAVTFPLVMELSGPRAIEDRVLAPVSVELLGLQKICSAALEGLVAGILVFPVVLLVHAAGHGPSMSLARWPLLVVVLVSGSMFSAALGMRLAVWIDPRRIQVLFTLVMFPAMMLGCVYFGWTSLAHTRWLQILVLANPMVYVDEGLRAALTPQVGHMSPWAFLPVLLLGAVGCAWLAVRSFARAVSR